MINQAPVSTARSRTGSIELENAVRADKAEFPIHAQPSTLNPQLSSLRIALLTGGGDKPYALGMAAALTSLGVHVDFVGSDDLNVPELLANPGLSFLNLRGDQRQDASSIAKVLRVLKYYARTVRC